MFTCDSEYEYYEPLLFKLVFSTYDEEKMEDHRFSDETLSDNWKLIDQVRQRKKRNMKTQRNFLRLRVIEVIWWSPQGFFRSPEMLEWSTNVKRNCKSLQKYLKHCDHFCELNWLNLNWFALFKNFVFITLRVDISSNFPIQKFKQIYKKICTCLLQKMYALIIIKLL